MTIRQCRRCDNMFTAITKSGKICENCKKVKNSGKGEKYTSHFRKIEVKP